MSWLLLLGAILSEVAGTLSLRASDGFTRPGPVLGVVVGYGVSFYLLSVVLRDLPLGLAYAAWAALGTALIAVIGIAAFGEPASAVRLACIAIVILGVVGAAAEHAELR